jgi:hypothetical protein
MSDITVINDSQQSELVTNGLAKNGELYLKAAGSTDEGAIVVYDSGSWRTFANEASSGFANTYSVAFDGTNDYMETGVPIVTGTSPISLSGWVYLTSTPSNYDQAIAIRGSTFSRTARMLGFVNGLLHFNTFASELKGTTTLSLNTWHHIAATSTSSGAARVYLNGVLEASGNVGYNSVSSGNTFVIAKGGIGECLPAKIDEVAVWGSVLSDGGVSVGQTAGGDIATLYNSGVPEDISSLSPLGWWRMGDNDGGTGTTITDQGSGGNDGTLTNGPTFSTDVPS